MKCPRCETDLLVSIRENIEIDCCAQCGGIWLDHGELIKLIAAYVPEMKERLQQAAGTGTAKVEG